MDEIDYGKLGDLTEGFSGSDLKEACRVAALNKIHSYVAEARQRYGDSYWYVCFHNPRREFHVKENG